MTSAFHTPVPRDVLAGDGLWAGTTTAEIAQGTRTQSYVSPSILVYEYLHKSRSLAPRLNLGEPDQFPHKTSERDSCSKNGLMHPSPKSLNTGHDPPRVQVVKEAVTNASHAPLARTVSAPNQRSMILCDTMYVLINFRKSTHPQNRQFIVHYY